MRYLDTYCPVCRRAGEVRFVAVEVSAGDQGLDYEFRCTRGGHLFTVPWMDVRHAAIVHAP